MRLRIDFKKYQTTKEKLENTDHVPILARNDFKLGSTNALGKNLTFKGKHVELVKKVDETILKYKNDMRKFCAEQADLEMMVKKSEIEELLALAYRALSTIFCASQGLDENHADHLLKLNIDSAPFLVSMCNVDHNAKYFNEIYMRVNKIEDTACFSLAPETPASTINSLKITSNILKNYLRVAFFQTWKDYEDQKQSNSRCLRLKALTKEFIKKKENDE